MPGAGGRWLPGPGRDWLSVDGQMAWSLFLWVFRAFSGKAMSGSPPPKKTVSQIPWDEEDKKKAGTRRLRLGTKAQKGVG